MTYLSLPEDKECAFCAYLHGSRPYTILWQDERTAAFVTREQRGEPHLLVLPIRHVHTILELANEEAEALLLAVRTAARVIDKTYKKAGIAVWQNNGKPAGQTIGHLHFHIAGTLEKGGTEWGAVPELSIDQTEKIADRLRPALEEIQDL